MKKTEIIMYELPTENGKRLWYLNINNGNKKSHGVVAAAFYLTDEDVGLLMKKLKDVVF